MAKSRVGGKNGLFAAPTGFNADFVSFDVETSQVVENDTAYGDTSASKIGNGLPEHVLTATGWAFKGTSNSAPGHAAFTDVGGTFTATHDTGCTHTGTGIARNLRTGNSRLRAASPVTLTIEVDGALGESWATS